MRKIHKTCAAAVLLFAGSVMAQGNKPINIVGFQDMSCGRWVASKDDEVARAQFISWFRGFMTGFNYASRDNQVSLDRMPDEDTLYLYVSKFCREEPLKLFTVAAFRLVNELAERPAGQRKR